MPVNPAVYKRIFSKAVVCLSIAVFGYCEHNAQSVAILTPDNTQTSRLFADHAKAKLSDPLEAIDSDLGRAVLESHSIETPYNLEASTAQRLGAAIGSHYLVFIKGDTVSRASLDLKTYYEAYAAVYLVSSKTGELVSWHLFAGEGTTPVEADAKLLLSVPNSVNLIGKEIRQIQNNAAEVEVLRNDEATDGVRPPLPYKRIKPAYTRLANLYDIDAIVDIEVEIDEAGKVADTKIVRWAGFGLDESVEKTVREMQWRPADLKGKTFAMKILLRYNFKDIRDPID